MNGDICEKAIVIHCFGHVGKANSREDWGKTSFKRDAGGTSLVVQWLKLCTSSAPTAGGVHWIPGLETEIPHVVPGGQKKKVAGFCVYAQSCTLESIRLGNMSFQKQFDFARSWQIYPFLYSFLL